MRPKYPWLEGGKTRRLDLIIKKNPHVSGGKSEHGPWKNANKGKYIQNIQKTHNAFEFLQELLRDAHFSAGEGFFTFLGKVFIIQS